MGQYCKCCGKKQSANEGTLHGRTFHRFPLKDPILLEIWRKELNIGPSFVPTIHSKICSDHFSPKCFEGTKKLRYLVPGSIPTLLTMHKGTCFFCNRPRDLKAGVSLHKFPLDRPDLLKRWLRAINIKDFVPQKDSLICSDHFNKTCFQEVKGRNYSNLRVNAVPSIFLREKGNPKQYSNTTDYIDLEFCNVDEIDLQEETETSTHQLDQGQETGISEKFPRFYIELSGKNEEIW